MRLPKVHLETEPDVRVTAHAGLVLASAFLRRYDVANTINNRVSVLKQYQPYTEADHILAQALNLFMGGTCLEDGARLQHDDSLRHMLGACRFPDPTTSGDFLRRFDPAQNPEALAQLRQSTDDIQSAVWMDLASRRGRGKKNKGRYNRKRGLVVLDIDGHQKELYGTKKEGADFSYKGKWSYQQLLISEASTGECVAVRNRPGNMRSSDGAAELLAPTLARVSEHFDEILVRGDSDFDRVDVRQACEQHGAHFAFVGREFPNRPGIAESIPEQQWKPFETRAARAAERKRKSGKKARKKRTNRRRQRARERNYKELRLVKQWIAEVPWSPEDSDATYRLVIRRQLIEEYKGQTFLFEQYRYRYIVTDLPRSVSTASVVDQTYERCDQENVIEQMGSGLAAWRMPVGDFAGNCAWLEIARLAWNLAKWIAQLALPDEVVRWEWKRFRNAWVYRVADVIKRSRQIWVRLRGGSRFKSELLRAVEILQT